VAHRHVGSIHASDAQMAMLHARDAYTRRNEGLSIWVVPSNAIIASTPDKKDALFEPSNDKVYRHPTFYNLPDEIDSL
jgi:ring-1,2-phenylacetyl-CoA epoxidase subunit PaaB